MIIIYVLHDNSVVIGVPAPNTLASMIGSGNSILANRVEAEIAIKVANGKSEAVAKAFVEALAYGGLSEVESLQCIADNDQPDGTQFIHLVEQANVPTSRVFRGGWEASGDTVVINMPKARAIHLAEIRRVRNEELVKEDITFMRAVEAGNTDAQTTIATKKQVLRDIPQTFDLTTGVTTPAQLLAKWPTELPARE